MKTVREIAAEIGIPKQRVYRYIKRECISEAHQRNGVMYYDEAAETIIKQGFDTDTASGDVHHEAHQNRITDAVTDAVIDLLQKELEIKNKQIAELTETVKIQAESINAYQQKELAGKIIEGKQLLDGSVEPAEPEQEKEVPNITVQPIRKASFIGRLFRRT